MKVINILALVLMSGLLHAQDKAPAADMKENQAKQVFEKARAAAGKKVSLKEIKGLTLITEETFQFTALERKIQGTRKIETSFVSPDKIRQKTLGDYSTNREDSTYVLNGDKFYSKIDIYVEGKLQQDFSSAVAKQTQISQLRHDTFIRLFPITLDASWYFPLDFQYVGVAESKDGKAEVVEAVTASKTKYRLFFDSATHLLLMMTQSWTDKEHKQRENKYYYSDYQEKGGLTVATKVVAENDGEVGAEKTVKDVKVNPTFKPDVFEAR
jgi:hypothetical protein